ncbi:MAG: hypothetical protein ACLQNE_08390 [Thermoguttaceae bacterium]
MPSAEQVFKHIDKNGDGMISKQEFMAAYAEFQKGSQEEKKKQAK